MQLAGMRGDIIGEPLDRNSPHRLGLFMGEYARHASVTAERDFNRVAR
jgi:hypothetical protein